jgi:hypothetical protein
MKLIRTLLAAATVAAALPALGAVAIATAVPNAHKVPPNFNVVTVQAIGPKQKSWIP